MDDKLFFEYDEFLDLWQPTDLLRHATQDSNLFDPFAQARLLADVAGTGTIPRTVKVPQTYNAMSNEEARLLHFSFFQDNQAAWSADFKQRMLADGVRRNRLDTFLDAMRTIWTDGSRRQTDLTMRRLKTAIYLHDQSVHPQNAGKFVINPADDQLDPLFSEDEVASLFDVNSNMLELYLAQYINERGDGRSGSINTLYTRRGACMPHMPKTHLEELHYLSSYSLATSPVELFAQTQGSNPCKGTPCIFSGPVPAVQQRVVAFAPFIRKMKLDQMELVIAPPIRPIELFANELLGNSTVIVHDYEFS